MNFFSSEFLVFVISMFALYWAIPKKYRNIPLIVGGYAFYACAGINYVAILAIFTVSSFIFGKVIEGMRNSGKNPKAVFITSILIPLITLFVFKYLDFTIQIISDISRHHFDALKIILPLGISFYTFQVVGYLTDIYRGTEKAEKDFLTFAAYISFFPQLAAGPIARTQTILPQFKDKKDFDYDVATSSLKRFTEGFFQKYFIAAQTGAFVDLIYGDIQNYSGGILLLAAVLFSLQIYFDFCGYTNMAIGLAGLFNIKLDENFKSPYFSQSIKALWERWHITLTTWLRDYVYVSLIGCKYDKFHNCLCITVTFLISGLWHGANYTYIIWGLLHGLAMSFEIVTGLYKESKGIISWFRIFIVFSFTNFTLIFFRVPDVSSAITILSKIFNGITNPGNYFSAVSEYIAQYPTKNELLIALVFILIFGIIDYRKLKKKKTDYISGLKAPLRWTIYIIIMFAIMLLVNVGSTEFIYAKF